ncbi:MAG: TetR/AcrR family transcriptional regulator [Pseudomonadota bacterium]
MPSNVDARIRKSQAAIISAGLELLGRNSEATLSDIAQQASVGRSTLYRLYETKEQLMRAIGVHCMQCFDAATQHLEKDADSALQAFHLMFKAVLPLSAEMEFLMKLGDAAEQDPELDAIWQKQKRDIALMVDAAKAEGSLSRQVPTAWAVNLVEALFYASWVTGAEEQMDHDALADLAFATFSHGIAQQATRA